MEEFCCNQMLNLSLSYLIYEMNESVKMQTCNASKWQWMALKYWWKEDCSVDSSVDLSCCHLLPNVTEIGEKADKVTSVPFQTTKVQGGTALEPWYQISTHTRVRCFLDICNSPSMLWLVCVIDRYRYKHRNSLIQPAKWAYWRPWNSVNIFPPLPIVCRKSICPPHWFWPWSCDLLCTMKYHWVWHTSPGGRSFKRHCVSPSSLTLSLPEVSMLQIPLAYVLKSEDTWNGATADERAHK